MIPDGRIVLDSGALRALAAGSEEARMVVERAIASDVEIVIPAVVLAESTVGSGPRDASVNRIVAWVDAVAPADEEVARLAGRLRHEARSTETVDALVAAEACRGGVAAIVLTGDRRSAHLADLTANHPHVLVRRV